VHATTPTELHIKSAATPLPVAERGAAQFGVSVDTFMNWRWQMKHQIEKDSDPSGSLRILPEEAQAFEQLRPVFHAGITPYYAALIDGARPDCPIRLQAVPQLAEMHDVLGVADPLLEVNNSPVREVVHVYPDRVAFCVAQLCPVYCRYCFRKRRDEETGLHFNPRIIDAGLNYIRSNPSIRDVLLTGGDPLVAHDESILKVVAALRQIPHVEIVRIGTRVPVTLPYRITKELAEGLAAHHPLWINTHFNCVEEVTPDAAAAVDTLLRAGIPVGNQSVLLRGVNDSLEKMKALNEALVRIRVRPYYIYHPQIVAGTEHLRVPIEKGLDIMRGLRGRTSGFAIPQYILDTPYGKLPLTPQNVIGRTGDNVHLRTNDGANVWSEPNPLDGYSPATPLPPMNPATPILEPPVPIDGVSS
jgi:lysine 2,3-aminomutase